MNRRKIHFLKELESHVCRIKTDIKNTPTIHSSSRVRQARTYMNDALHFAEESSIEDRFGMIIVNLQNAERELEESKRDFHSGKVEAIRNDIHNVLEMAISRM